MRNQNQWYNPNKKYFTMSTFTTTTQNYQQVKKTNLPKQIKQNIEDLISNLNQSCILLTQS